MYINQKYKNLENVNYYKINLNGLIVNEVLLSFSHSIKNGVKTKQRYHHRNNSPKNIVYRKQLLLIQLWEKQNRQ